MKGAEKFDGLGGDRAEECQWGVGKVVFSAEIVEKQPFLLAGGGRVFGRFWVVFRSCRDCLIAVIGRIASVESADGTIVLSRNVLLVL